VLRTPTFRTVFPKTRDNSQADMDRLSDLYRAGAAPVPLLSHIAVMMELPDALHLLLGHKLLVERGGRRILTARSCARRLSFRFEE
jgi:hypothetical protein